MNTRTQEQLHKDRVASMAEYHSVSKLEISFDKLEDISNDPAASEIVKAVAKYAMSIIKGMIGRKLVPDTLANFMKNRFANILVSNFVIFYCF